MGTHSTKTMMRSRRLAPWYCLSSSGSRRSLCRGSITSTVCSHSGSAISDEMQLGNSMRAALAQCKLPILHVGCQPDLCTLNSKDISCWDIQKLVSIRTWLTEWLADRSAEPMVTFTGSARNSAACK